MLDPTTRLALCANVPPAYGILRIALYNCIIAGRVKDKPTAEIFVKALTDNKFVQSAGPKLRETIARIDLRHGAFGPDSSFWLDDPSGWDAQASAESKRVRQALPGYTTKRR